MQSRKASVPYDCSYILYDSREIIIVPMDVTLLSKDILHGDEVHKSQQSFAPSLLHITSNDKI